MSSLTDRLFRRMYRVGRRYAWATLLFFAVVTGFGVYYGMDIPLRSSFLDLLPTNDPLIDEYRENEQYSEVDYVALLLRLEENVPDAVSERKQLLLAAAEAIAVGLRDDPEFVEVKYVQDVSPDIPDQYLYLFQLGKDELRRIEESITLAQDVIAVRETSVVLDRSLGSVYKGIGDSLDHALYQLDLSEQGVGTAATGFSDELQSLQELNRFVSEAIAGLDELPAVTDAVVALSGVFAPSLDVGQNETSAFWSEDRTRLVMTVQPRYPSQRGVTYSELVSDRIGRAIENADLDRFGVTVGMTGTYAFNDQTNAVVSSDMVRTTIISSIGVFVIFFLAFGSISYSIIAVVPLLVSVLLTMCWAKLALGGFNLVTTFLPALVLGLGIDYAIHLLSRYTEERQRGQSLNRSLYLAVRHKGEASLVAALTTSLVFVGLLTARSRALFEMGVISGVSVIIAYLATMLLLPSLITLSHFLFRKTKVKRFHNRSARLAGVFRFITGKGRAIFVIVLVLTFFVAFQAAQTAFVFSSNDLVPHVETQDVTAEIMQEFDISLASLGTSFTFYADSEEGLRGVVDWLESNDLVESVDSAVGILPVNLTEQQQLLNSLDISAYIRQLELLQASIDERPAILAEIRALLAQFSLVQFGSTVSGELRLSLLSRDVFGQLRAIQLQLQDLNTDAATRNVSALVQALGELDENLAQLRELPPVETLLRDILLAYPDSIRSQYLTGDGRFVIQVGVARDIFEKGNLEAFCAVADTLDAEYFGLPLVVQQLEIYMKRDFYLSTAIAAVLILFILWRSLRGWMRALLAATPLLLGYVWMLGGMRLLSIDFNFFSITISPLLIGIGVDNGIHILHRTMEERRARIDEAIERSMSTTAVAVIVTSLTTMLVFGSLLAARTPGLRQLGVSALLGIGFALVFSLVFLPAVLHVEGGKRL